MYTERLPPGNLAIAYTETPVKKDPPPATSRPLVPASQQVFPRLIFLRYQRRYRTSDKRLVLRIRIRIRNGLRSVPRKAKMVPKKSYVVGWGLFLELLF
jgi:hypothetical protein